MGKDQDLLDAARNGNLSVAEKILGQRAKRSGPLASLRRGPGANVQDNSGYTPLHHAALNGHKDIVLLLLSHDASPNVVDHKGSSPLHLGAWTGNTEIVKMLLVQSNVPPNVNLTNGDGETALHCASQYGHADVVGLLLAHSCDASRRNARDETALELAAQYGRLGTVEALVRAQPDLATAGHPGRHSALHLAARNGHRRVVQVLLDAGFPVNARTDSGSALHEAAVFGKTDVVRLLLDRGVDLEVEDYQRRTVLDILVDLNTHMSHEMAAIIRNYGSLITTADSDIRNANSTHGSAQFASSPYENVTLPGRWGPADVAPHPGGGGTSPHSPYQVPPPSRAHQRHSSAGGDDRRTPSGMELRGSSLSPDGHQHLLESSMECGSSLSSSSVYQTPPPPRDLDDAMSIGSSYYETPPTPREVAAQQRQSLPEGDPNLLYQVPPPPREILKRMSDPSAAGSGTPLRTSGGADPTVVGGGYVSMAPVREAASKINWAAEVANMHLRPPQKPPRKTVSPHSPTKYQVQGGPAGGAYEYLCLASSGGGGGGGNGSRPTSAASSCDEPVAGVEGDTPRGASPNAVTSSGAATILRLQASHSLGDYVDMKVRRSYVPSSTTYENDVPCFRRDQRLTRDTLSADELDSPVANVVGQRRRSAGPPAYENVTIRAAPNVEEVAAGSERLRKPNSLDLHATTTNSAANKRQPQQRSDGAGTKMANGGPAVLLHHHQRNGGAAVTTAVPTTTAGVVAASGEGAECGEGQPLSPSSYEQPPTPDFPPPSPATAESGIHSKMRPLSQEYKRRSRDNETLTEDEVFQLIEENGEVLLRVVTQENKSVSTENIEEVRGDAPFAGLHRGSKPPASGSSTDGETDTCGEDYRTPCSLLSSPCEWSDAPTTASTTTPGSRNGNGPGSRSAGFRRQANVYENVVLPPGGGTGGSGTNSTAATESGAGVVPPRLRLSSCNGAGGGGAYENVVDYSSVLSPFDENAEWAKINDIMASFGASVLRPAQQGENSSSRHHHHHHHHHHRHSHENGGDSGRSGSMRIELSPLGLWLTRLGVGEYENVFLTNGFDDLKFMGGDMLEESDLLEMGVNNAEHRRIILEATRSLPAVRAVQATCSVKGGVSCTVDEWLRGIRLYEAYADVFRRHKYTDMERVLKMWEVELTTILEVTRPGHKKRILLSLGERPPAPAFDVDDLNTNLTQLKRDISQLEQMDRSGNRPPSVSSSTDVGPNGTLRRRNGSNKPPAPAPPPRRSSSKSPCDPGKEGLSLASEGGGNADGINIRDPSQLFTGIPSALTAQWKHRAEDFVLRACNYTAKYLGSTLVKELRGLESSKKSIQKLKKSTNDIAKVPNVILSISYRGVKFIDANTKNAVCEHEIRNINCACQDADDLNHFAYVTKDHTTGNHYCHVFGVATMDMATEIILTLGQAFEVAYQMALRDKGTSGNGISSTATTPRRPLSNSSSASFSASVPAPLLVSPRTHEQSAGGAATLNATKVITSPPGGVAV